MGNYSLSVSGAIGSGWECAKKHGLMVAVILLGITIVSSIFESLTGVSMDTSQAMELGKRMGEGDMGAIEAYREMLMASSGAPVFSFVLSTLIYVGLYNLALGLLSGRLTEAGFDVFKLPLMVYVKFFVLEILVGIIASVSIALCVIPAFFIIPRVAFAPIYLIDNPHAGIIESLTSSWRMTSGSTLSIIGLGLAFLGILIVGLLCCCIGVYFADAVILFAFAAAYYQMRGNLS